MNSGLTPEQLAEWRADAHVMRDFLRTPAWTVLRKHLERLHAEALRRSDAFAPDAVDHVMHWRAVRKGIEDAMAVPENIVAQVTAIDEQQTALAATRRLAQKGRR